jgi:hypothetical protein
MQRGKRDFTSTSQVLASSYDVIVAPDHSAEARRILAQLPMSTAAARPAPYHGQQNIQQTPPQRPDGWTDPYGGPAASEPPAADPRTQTPVDGAIVPEAGPTPGSYHDLPDGRPQYGIRLPESEPTESAEQGAPEQPARQHTPQTEQPQHDA